MLAVRAVLAGRAVLFVRAMLSVLAVALALLAALAAPAVLVEQSLLARTAAGSPRARTRARLMPGQRVPQRLARLNSGCLTPASCTAPAPPLSARSRELQRAGSRSLTPAPKSGMRASQRLAASPEVA